MNNKNQIYPPVTQFKELALHYLLLIADFEHKRIMSEIVWLNARINNKKVNTSSIMMIRSHNEIPDYIFMQDGSYEYKCPELDCEKTYTSISHIKRHYLKHLKTKPLRCLNYPICPKYFTRKDNMMLHFRTRCKYSVDVDNNKKFS